MHWPRTLLARRGAKLRREHLRFRPRDAGAGVLHCFLLDCSGSMLGAGGSRRIGALLLQLLQLAYQQRSDVALVSFAGARATTHVRPTAATPPNSRTVQRWLGNIGAGGGTPFADAVVHANDLLARARRAHPAQQRWLWLISDGRSREAAGRPPHADVRVVIDCEWQRIALGRCRELAARWEAEYFLMEHIERR